MGGRVGREAAEEPSQAGPRQRGAAEISGEVEAVVAEQVRLDGLAVFVEEVKDRS